jgi:hypothetical protein
VSPAIPQFPALHTLTEEELALLRQADLLKDGAEEKHYEDRGRPSPPSFWERLVLGDISW